MCRWNPMTSCLCRAAGRKPLYFGDSRRHSRWGPGWLSIEPEIEFMKDSHLLPHLPDSKNTQKPVELIPRPYLEAPASGQPHDSSEAEGLIIYWRILRRHRGIMAMGGVLGIIAG